MRKEVLKIVEGRIMTFGKYVIAKRAIYKRCKQSIAMANNRADIYKAIRQMKKELAQINYDT